jgi:hypothetical protein
VILRAAADCWQRQSVERPDAGIFSSPKELDLDKVMRYSPHDANRSRLAVALPSTEERFDQVVRLPRRGTIRRIRRIAVFESGHFKLIEGSAPVLSRLCEYRF